MKESIAILTEQIFDEFGDRSYGWFSRRRGRESVARVRRMIDAVRLLQRVVDAGCGDDIVLCVFHVEKAQLVQLPQPKELLN